MRSRYPVAVHLFFLRENQILLLRRFNTGYEDGNYSVPAGHVETGETVTRAAIREAMEEVGVIINPADMQIVHVMNRKSEDERIDFFVALHKWMGEATNAEPEKCDEIQWMQLGELPLNTIPYVKHALECFQSGKYYSEFGWE